MEYLSGIAKWYRKVVSQNQKLQKKKIQVIQKVYLHIQIKKGIYAIYDC